MSFSIGSLETKWKFLVVDNLNESVLGADFIESHHTTSWGISGDNLWLDDLGIPLTNTKNVLMVSEQNHLPVVAKCTVELPPRHQVIIPLRTKDKSCKNGVFEPTKTPGGVLLSKTAVQGGKDGSFWVKAVNLTSSSVTIFKNQRTGTISEIEDMSEPFHLNSRKQKRTVYNINTHTSCAASTLNEIGVDLRGNVSKNQTYSIFRGQSSKIDFAHFFSIRSLMCLEMFCILYEVIRLLIFEKIRIYTYPCEITILVSKYA